MYTVTMKEIRWKLGEQLQARGVTAYRLAQQLEKRVSRNTVYAIARGDAKGVQFDTLAAVLEALERESGRPVALTDVLEEIEQPVALTDVLKIVADPIPSSTRQQDPLELSSAAELQATLETLETDTPPAELNGWLERFEQIEQAGA